MTLGMEVGLGPGHIVLDGDQAPPAQKRGHIPQFPAHFYCGHTVALSATAENLSSVERAGLCRLLQRSRYDLIR